MWWNRKKNKTKQEVEVVNPTKVGDLRIVELINGLDEKKYAVEEYFHYDCWVDWKIISEYLDTYEDANKYKSEMENTALRNIIVKKNIL